MDLETLQETRAVIARQWQVETSGDTADDAAWALLREALAERILHLLKTDQPKLMRAMYVLDISEKRYNAAMSKKPPEAAAAALAEAVLDRESDKIAMRKKYARHSTPETSDVPEA